MGEAFGFLARTFTLSLNLNLPIVPKKIKTRNKRMQSFIAWRRIYMVAIVYKAIKAGWGKHTFELSLRLVACFFQGHKDKDIPKPESQTEWRKGAHSVSLPGAEVRTPRI
jgi:hypothetical protein